MKTDAFTKQAMFIIGGGRITALAGGPISLAGMGKRRTRRVSTIKFVPRDDMWRVRDMKGKELANFKKYDEALQWEVDYYNLQLAEGVAV